MLVVDRILSELAGIDQKRLTEPVLVGETVQPNQTVIGEVPAEARPLILLKLDYEQRIMAIEETFDAEIAAIDSREQAAKRAEELQNQLIDLASIHDAIGKLLWAELRLALPAAAQQSIIGLAENWQVYTEDQELCPRCGKKHPQLLPELIKGVPPELMALLGSLGHRRR